MTDKVTAIIKTLDRPAKLEALYRSLRNYYPNIPVVIVDDSIHPAPITFDENTKYIHVEPDIGLAAGRNLALSHVHTPYTLLLDDDYVFFEKTKLEVFLSILETTDFDLVAGEVLNNKKDRLVYRGVYQVKDAVLIMLHNKSLGKHQGLLRYDYVVNFFMAHTKSLRDCLWLESLKVCEHEAFFLDFKKMDKLVTSTSKVQIYHFPTTDTAQNPEYFKKRRERFDQFYQIALHHMDVRGLTKIGSPYIGWYRVKSYMYQYIVANTSLPIIGFVMKHLLRIRGRLKTK